MGDLANPVLPGRPATRGQSVLFRRLLVFMRLIVETTSGFVCNFDDHVTGNLILKNEFEAFGRHISSLDHPFFALLDKNHRHEAQGRFT